MMWIHVSLWKQTTDHQETTYSHTQTHGPDPQSANSKVINQHKSKDTHLEIEGGMEWGGG